jgi:molybdenum cofactor biosynthesis enzyme MoaA
VRLLDVILGYDCNLYCEYCTITPQMRARALTPQAVVRALREGRAGGLEAVSFTGGEPTLRGDLLALVREARRLGYADIKVQSNGLLFAHGPNLDRLVDAGVTRFAVSIHTHEEHAYERLVQRAGTWAAMVEGLSALVARGLDPQADVILMRDTAPRLPAAIAWLHGLGVRKADLWFVSLTDNNAANVDSMPRMTDVVPTMAEAFAFARAHDMQLRSLHVPRCLLGADAAHAHDPAARGVRVVTPDATFDLRGSKLTGQRHVPACEGCEHEAYCPGLRDDYLARYGDAEVANARGRTPSRPGVRLPVV